MKPTRRCWTAKPIALAPYGEAKFKFDALAPMRLAAPFEALRDKSDAMLKESGARPKIFLANLGTPADFTARATFAKSFFETGGIEADRYRGLCRSGSARRRLQGLRRRAGLPVFPDKVYAATGGRRRKGPSSRRSKAYLSGRAARRAGSCAARAGVERFHLCRRRCAGNAAGSLPADGVSMTTATKPVLTGGCQCGAIRFALSAPPTKVSICHCRMCQKASGAPFASFADIEKERFRLDPRQAGGVPLLLDRRARLLRGLRHAAELPPHRRPQDRDHDRHLRPARPGGPDPAIWHRIPARLGGRHRQSAEPDHAAELRAGEDGHASSATSIRTMIEARDHDGSRMI